MTDSIIKYFHVLYDQIRFPIEVVNVDGNVVYVNEVFTIQWGYTFSELKEYNVFSDSELGRNGVQDLIKETLDNKKYSTVENYSDSLLSNRDVAVPLLRSSIFPVEFDDDIFAVLLHEDKTEAVLTEEEIKKARDASQESERLKNTFLNVLSHELRTPLNIILGYSTIIRENLRDKFSAEEKVYLDNLYAGSSRLFKSITQMLEFAQIEAGNYRMSIDSYDLVEVVNGCINTNKQNALDKKINIKARYAKKKIFVDMDLQCTETAINNIIDNAIKFTMQGFIDIEVELLAERGLATCKIKDTGIGISSEYLDHLYQPFSQEEMNIGRNFEGNGLGLALSKRYIEKMGGSILVDSIKGVGTTFTITLPLSKVQHPDIQEQQDAVTSGTNKILMLDEAGESFELIKAFLKGEYEFERRKFKDFNIDTIADDEYSFLILDVLQNYWDKSLKLVKQIKDTDPYKRPVLVLSSEFMHDKIAQFYQAGADKFLVKPFARNDLLLAIGKISTQ